MYVKRDDSSNEADCCILDTCRAKVGQFHDIETVAGWLAWACPDDHWHEGASVDIMSTEK